MQTKLLLLAAAPAALASLTPVANLQPRVTAMATDSATSAADDLCATALLEVFSIVQDIPTPTGSGLDSYTATAFDDAQTPTDICSLIAAAPSSLQSALLSYRSAIASALHANPDVVSTLSSCAAQETNGDADQLAQLANLPSCTGASSTAASSTGNLSTGTSSSGASNSGASSSGVSTTSGSVTHNAAPRETGMAAMGFAAAAVVGVVGML